MCRGDHQESLSARIVNIGSYVPNRQSSMYSLGQQVEEKVLQHVFWKFPLLVWVAWQVQFSPSACGTLRKHVIIKPFPQPASSKNCPKIAKIPKCVLNCLPALPEVDEEDQGSDRPLWHRCNRQKQTPPRRVCQPCLGVVMVKLMTQCKSRRGSLWGHRTVFERQKNLLLASSL